MHTCILTKISIRFIFGLFTFLVDFLKKFHLPLNFALSAVYKLNRILLTSSVFFFHPNRIEKKNIEYRICQLFAPKIY